MIPTPFGIAIGIIGILLLLYCSIPAMFCFVLLCSLMGGTAALSLPALGDSSIPPAQFALAFFVLRYLLPGSSQGHVVREAVRANLSLLLYVIYGLAIAYVGPRLFADRLDVVPMRYSGNLMFGTTPLQPTSQNITTPVYLVGTFICAVGSYVACRDPRGAKAMGYTAIAIALIHMFFGISGVLLKGTPYEDFLSLFRNGNYAQLDQRVGSVVRMNGIFPEPSAFAAYGFGWFVFLFECWYRDFHPKLTGWVALALLLTLMATTSSTAYVGIAAYAVIFFLRTLCFISDVRSRKVLLIFAGLLVSAIVISAVLIAWPSLIEQGLRILVVMTIDKQSSDSGQQRAFWAQQGLNHFFESMGIGIGPGSFRSSSFVSAVAGSMGIVGLVTFGIYFITILKPLRASTYNARISDRVSVGVAASWAAVALLLIGTFGAPSPDPGNDFAVFAGAALALRRRTAAEPNAGPAVAPSDGGDRPMLRKPPDPDPRPGAPSRERHPVADLLDESDIRFPKGWQEPACEPS
jgi:hypothetical protein